MPPQHAELPDKNVVLHENVVGRIIEDDTLVDYNVEIEDIRPHPLSGSQMSFFEDDDIVLGDTDTLKLNMGMAAKWNSAEYQADVYAGNRIAYYKLNEEIGDGKFSRVKVGEHSITEDKVAVKIVEKARIEQRRHHVFKREIRMLDSCHHPNICRLLEYIDTYNQLYIIMELARGQNLQRFVNHSGPLKELLVRKLFIQVVSAVHHLHSKNIAHRDIKADNIVIDPQTERIKLVDFGFACFSDDDTFSTTFCGSPPYAAPELFSSRKYRAKPVDIWALGCLFYFMYCGTMPFAGRSMFELKAAIRYGKYVVPRNATVYVKRLLKGTLNLNPMDRFTIQRVMNCSWLSHANYPSDSLELSGDRQHPDMAVQKMVYRTFNHLQSQYNVSLLDLQAALSRGVRDPLTGLYRLTFMGLMTKDDDVVRENSIEYKKSVHDAVTKMRNDGKKRPKKASKVCTIL
ncbi:unnamed protein product [Bursaphelenchus xylophilus]|uniref:non-specific serine/threonine protein kinase n=1 Tax=Bursaphelenchus xylophilus TaxID=6326 RepID=A0A1I7SQG9_BURXY|nr:unnamed protein product [Bursaphelenchus xylophilus]CAG9109880.1 unnamed protein product [Bursaphelenchus xylophilus]